MPVFLILPLFLLSSFTIMFTLSIHLANIDKFWSNFMLLNLLSFIFTYAFLAYILFLLFSNTAFYPFNLYLNLYLNLYM